MKLRESFVAAFRIGLESARANLVPILILWGLGVAAVVAYYRMAGFRMALDPVFQWRLEYGWKVVFPWTVLVVAPPNAVFYFWLGRDMSLARCRREWPRGGFLTDILFQNLVCNWIVWIPLTVVVFCFPQPLRVWVSGIASAFWFLMSLQIGARVCKERGGDVTP